MATVPPLPRDYQNAGLSLTQISYCGFIGESEIVFSGAAWEKELAEGCWQIVIPHPGGSFCCGVAANRPLAIEYALRSYVDLTDANQDEYLE